MERKWLSSHPLLHICVDAFRVLLGADFSDAQERPEWRGGAAGPVLALQPAEVQGQALTTSNSLLPLCHKE